MEIMSFYIMLWDFLLTERRSSVCMHHTLEIYIPKTSVFLRELQFPFKAKISLCT